MKHYHISEKFKSAWQKNILDWYRVNCRKLPWREPRNQKFYNIWISEIMLQQTKVKTVIPYYNNFIKKWPNIEDLYDATLDEILTLWQGLGYYQRAKNIFLAKEFMKKQKIALNLIELKKLPGIGDYVSSAICAILNDENCVVVDSNIKKIISRVFDLDKSKKGIENEIRFYAQQLTPDKNNKFYCQSLMDLANLICTNTNPRCLECPVNNLCKASQKVIEYKKKRSKKKSKIGITYIVKYKNFILLEKSSKKILENLYCFPMTSLVDFPNKKEEKLNLSIIDSEWVKNNSIKHDKIFEKYVKHSFSHFHLKLFIIEIKLRLKDKFENFEWVLEEDLKKKPSSVLMKKIQMEVF